MTIFMKSLQFSANVSRYRNSKSVSVFFSFWYKMYKFFKVFYATSNDHIVLMYILKKLFTSHYLLFSNKIIFNIFRKKIILRCMQKQFFISMMCIFRLCRLWSQSIINNTDCTTSNISNISIITKFNNVTSDMRYIKDTSNTTDTRSINSNIKAASDTKFTMLIVDTLILCFVSYRTLLSNC